LQKIDDDALKKLAATLMNAKELKIWRSKLEVTVDGKKRQLCPTLAGEILIKIGAVMNNSDALPCIVRNGKSYKPYLNPEVEEINEQEFAKLTEDITEDEKEALRKFLNHYYAKKNA
jgi:hypothetical protein